MDPTSALQMLSTIAQISATILAIFVAVVIFVIQSPRRRQTRFADLPWVPFWANFFMFVFTIMWSLAGMYYIRIENGQVWEKFVVSAIFWLTTGLFFLTWFTWKLVRPVMRAREEEEECDEEREEEAEIDWEIWTDPLEELSEIEDAFRTDEKGKLHGKTILDIGTDCVKPLYIALKYEPEKIIGINEDFSLYPFESELKQKSRFFTKTKIDFFQCSLFDDENVKKILKKNKFDFILISKTLHHLRTGECVAEKRGQKHTCREDEKCCIYKFEEEEIFKRLLRMGKRVIIYETFYPHERDEDKVRGRGGYFTITEWTQIFEHLSNRSAAGSGDPAGAK